MIRLEHFERSDFKQLIEWIPDESMLITWSGSLFKFPLTTESLEWYIKDTNDLQHSDAFVYKAVDDETGEVIQKHAEKNGFSVVREYCGHGIGAVFHEEPQVLHYGKAGEGMALVEGMTFTIEPMINAGSHQTKLKSDGWTVVTRDNRLSAQYEHTLAVTADGVEVLTRRTEETLPC